MGPPDAAMALEETELSIYPGIRALNNKIGDGLKKAGSALQSFDSKHDVSGKTAGAITAAGNWITKTLQSKEQNAPPPPPPNGHQGVYRR